MNDDQRGKVCGQAPRVLPAQQIREGYCVPIQSEDYRPVTDRKILAVIKERRGLV
jgi:hypothetical protein